MAKKSWRGERAKGNKYSGGDKESKPKPGTRKRFWRSGYKKADGTRVEGHYVSNIHNYKGKK
jgi:hypothetical protein